MTAFFLWLYGFLFLGSLTMVVGWGEACVKLAREADGPLLWCRAWVIAAGLTLHAAAMAVACGYRSFDIFAHGTVAAGSEVRIQVAILVALGAAKALWVWAVSLPDGGGAIRWPWWAYLYALILWGVFCWAWASSAGFVAIF